MAWVLRKVARIALAIALLGVLGIVLFVGLDWALNPDDRPLASDDLYDPLTGLAPDETEREAPPPATVAPAPPPGPATPTEPPPEVLIAAAAAPTETTVQILDAGGGSAAVDRAAVALEQLGYQVIAVNPSERDVAVTTIYFVGEHEPEARALRARDPRFQSVEPNQGLSEGVDLHVLVAPSF